ncbi:MAG: phytanoyl-CoA dioxygenase family protein [Gammaproteobacteria bacterium]
MDTHLQIRTQDTSLADFKKDGLLIVRNKIDAAKIQTLIKEINEIREFVKVKIQSMDRPLKTYSDIAERHLGRLDYRCGFTADIFDEVAEPILQLSRKVSPTIDFRYYWGAIPSESGSGPTDFHRDVYPILNTTEGVNLDTPDLCLPPYYLTVLIPLVEITPENGPTEFIKGSQHIKIVNEDTSDIYAPLLSPGDFVMFDGRTMHRGSPNKSKDERLIAYMTLVANWYHDQTFEINDYLFPEVAVKGK